MVVDVITWTANPNLLAWGPFTIRWYGLMWAIGFVLGFIVQKNIYKREGYPEDTTEQFFMYMMISTVIGARIGHCFFYDFDYYSSHLLEVFCIWKGGLSSHGGAIGILIAMYIYSRKVLKKSYLWTLDRTVISVAITGACIRFGNLMNHEIYGHETDLPWGFRFITNLGSWMKGASPEFSEPSHPTQIYEMIYCLVTFSFIMFLYWKTNARKYEGFIFGVFLIGIFLTRFLLEFIKNNQELFEDDMVLNMGQILSLPLIITGVYLLGKTLITYINNNKSVAE